MKDLLKKFKTIFLNGRIECPQPIIVAVGESMRLVATATCYNSSIKMSEATVSIDLSNCSGDPFLSVCEKAKEMALEEAIGWMSDAETPTLIPISDSSASISCEPKKRGRPKGSTKEAMEKKRMQEMMNQKNFSSEIHSGFNVEFEQEESLKEKSVYSNEVKKEDPIQELDSVEIPFDSPEKEPKKEENLSKLSSEALVARILGKRKSNELAEEFETEDSSSNEDVVEIEKKSVHEVSKPTIIPEMLEDEELNEKLRSALDYVVNIESGGIFSQYTYFNGKSLKDLLISPDGHDVGYWRKFETIATLKSFKNNYPELSENVRILFKNIFKVDKILNLKISARM